MNSTFLFDIDGTLMTLDRGFMKPLIEAVLESLSMGAGAIGKVPYAGRTDSAIFRDLLGEEGQNRELYARLKKRYLGELSKNLEPAHITVHEGAVQSVEYLANRGIATGLCTGNFREAAYIKLKAAGLAGHFPFGAFGCSHHNRNYLPAEAEKQFVEYSGSSIEKKNFIIIGDTPNDIGCARYFGATSVAVATGHYTLGELEKHQPDLALENLCSPATWIARLA